MPSSSNDYSGQQLASLRIRPIRLFDRVNSSVLSRERKIANESESCTIGGNLLHTFAAATLNARSRRRRWSAVQRTGRPEPPLRLSAAAVETTSETRCNWVAR